MLIDMPERRQAGFDVCSLHVLCTLRQTAAYLHVVTGSSGRPLPLVMTDGLRTSIAQVASAGMARAGCIVLVKFVGRRIAFRALVTCVPTRQPS